MEETAPAVSSALESRESSLPATSKRSRSLVTSSGIAGGGEAPRDVGLQIERGRTSKGGSTPLENSPAPTAGEGEEEAPTFRILPRSGGRPSGEVGGFRFTLLIFFANTSRRARSSPCVGFAIRGSETEGEEDLET